MAGIRSILAVAGRTKLASPQHEKLSNHALGLSNASRDGTKVAISEERYLSAFYHAEKQDMGVAMTMQLARYFGLRTEEGIQSAKSLKTWQRALLQGEKSVRVVFGTKGGRPRDTTIIDRDKMLYAVNQALNLASQSNGKLIDKPDLKSAIVRYRNVVRNAGLTGKYAPHSLRYAWAVDAMDYHKNNVSALYPSLENLVKEAQKVGVEPTDQVFNVGGVDLMKRKKHPKSMGEYPLRSFFKRLSAECNFIISPHRFRHTVATHMMQSPERNLYVVKRLLGHASITSTLEYIDESVDNLRDILEAELM